MVAAPASVHACTSPYGTALLDTRHGAGHWRFLDPIGADLRQRITTGTPAEQAIDELTDHWQQHGAEPATVRRDLTAVLAALQQADLLIPVQQITTAADAAPAVLFATPVPLSPGLRFAAALALAATLLLLRLPIRYTVAAARAAAALPGKPATADQAQAAHHAVRRAARWWPGRAACLEESLAAYLAGALTGRHVDWVLGAAFMPRAAHAWTEAESAVIGQEPTDRIWRYLPVLRISRPA